MSSKLELFAFIKAAFRGRDPVGASKSAVTATPPNVAPPSPSKGPPPLPKMTVPAPLPPDEPLIFHEGIDGHAESIPDGASSFAFEGTGPLGGSGTESAPAARSTIPPPSLGDQWLQEGEAEEEEEEEEEATAVEDPARTQRRRAARVGIAWGAVLALAAAGATMLLTPRSGDRSTAATTGPAPADATDAPPPAMPQALPGSPLPLPTPTRGATASVPSAAPAAPASSRPGTLPAVAAHARKTLPVMRHDSATRTSPRSLRTAKTAAPATTRPL